MKHKRKIISLSLIVLFVLGVIIYKTDDYKGNNRFLTHVVNTKTETLQFFWKNENGEMLFNFQNLKKYVESKNLNLTFAMNGGMYNQFNSPKGLYIENGKTLSDIDTFEGKGNFYLKPNGVFYITNDNSPKICQTNAFLNNQNVKYATQSGPMLLIDGQIHPDFVKGSKNLNIRNGVDILSNHQVVFVMSLQEINFYDFAQYFKSLGCKNALYLDGFVSRTYLPEQQWIQIDGHFGAMIGVVEKQTKVN